MVGGVCVGAASAWLTVLSPRIWPLLVGVLCVDDGSVGVLPRGWRGDGAVLVQWRLRPRARRRRAAVFSHGGAELLRYVRWSFKEAAGGVDVEGVLRTVMVGSGLPRPDQELGELGARRRPTSLRIQDPVLRGWWLLRSIDASWLGVLPVPRVRRRDVDEGLRVNFHLYPLSVILYVCVFKLCIQIGRASCRERVYVLV